MARATRSTVQADADKPSNPKPVTRKGKRKRNSNDDAGEQPASKQARADNSQEPEENVDQPDATTKEQPGSGDVPILTDDAEKILDILEMVDTQGLLDRVFPLPTDTPDTDGASPPSTSTQSHSLRALLKNSSEHPLRVLRSAVEHLFPISSHPRSRPSPTAAQQLRFCNLALSLLDLASFHSVPTTLDVISIFPALFDSSAEAGEPPAPAQQASTSSTAEVRKRKYALVQRLPTGDWWTSLNSEFASMSVDGRELKDLPTGHAELAAILPSPSAPATAPQKTLATYILRKNNIAEKPLPGPRRVSCGRFLDYGPYGSFAPCFDQEGVEVGRVGLGEVLYQHHLKMRFREKGKQRALPVPDRSALVDGDRADEPGIQKEDTEAVLEGLLPPEEVAAIKSAMGTLELEQAVQDLLDKNARALKRLQRLQRERLGGDGGGSSMVSEDSEEWDTAQAIINSFAVLASLRPRSSSGDTDVSPFIPPTAVLRTLQRTLPVGVKSGWYGTLPANRATALHDDTTIKVKPGVPTQAPAPAPAPAIATAVVTPTKTTTPTTSYTPYNYSNYASSQYRGGYGTYAPGQTGSYYSNFATGQSNAHYPNAQYNATSQYPYGSWYSYQQSTTTGNSQTPTTATAAASATPQTATTPNTYASFFASTAQSQSQRAVANTVLNSAAAKAYQPGSWAAGQTGTGYTAPTLPPHLRTAVAGTSTPGTPSPTTGYTAQSIYGSYQATPSTTR